MSKPRVTALINTYNYGCFIEEAVESVLAQDYPKESLEIVVVDDGSTDDTPQRMVRFGSRVQYHRVPHGGQAAALNFGIANSTGEIVAFLDADDTWAPNKISRAAAALEAEPQAAFLYHAFRLWSSDNLEVPQQEFRAISGWIADDESKLLRIDGQATSGQVVRRSLLERMLPLPLDFVIGCSDGYIAYNSFFATEVLAIAEPLTNYRLHGSNLFSFNQQNPEKARVKLECWQALMREHRAWLARTGVDLAKPAVKKFLERQEIAEAWMKFALARPNRRELFGLLMKEQRLFAPVWSPGYRLMKLAAVACAYLLGFESYYGLRQGYSSARLLRGARHALLPRMRTAD